GSRSSRVALRHSPPCRVLERRRLGGDARLCPFARDRRALSGRTPCGSSRSRLRAARRHRSGARRSGGRRAIPHLSRAAGHEVGRAGERSQTAALMECPAAAPAGARAAAGGVHPPAIRNSNTNAASGSLPPQAHHGRFQVGSFMTQVLDRPMVAAPIPPAKRALDVALSGFGLIASSPLWAILALAIKLEDGGPVFFSQERAGEGGRTFRAWKFRSMIPDAERHVGAVQAVEDDPRITRIGKLMRATAMDELP